MTAARLLAAVRTVLRLGWTTHRLRSALDVLIVLANRSSAVLVALLARDLLDAVLVEDTSAAWRAAIAVSLVELVSFLGYVLGYDLVRLPLMEGIAVTVDETMMHVFGAPPTLDAHESPDALDDRELVRAHRKDLGDSFEDLVRWAANVLQVVATIAILATLDPRAALLPLFAVPAVLAM